MTDSPHSCIYIYIYIYNKNKKYITVETIPISKRKFTDRGQIDSPSIHTHDSSISWLGTGTSMNKNVEFKLFLTSEKPDEQSCYKECFHFEYYA